MVTLKIDAPEVERRIRESAAARQMDAEEYLVQLVQAHLPAVGSVSRPRLSVKERKAILHRFAELIPADVPPLPDEAFSRENLYDERGL